jgi:hypothetical protein
MEELEIGKQDEIRKQDETRKQNESVRGNGWPESSQVIPPKLTLASFFNTREGRRGTEEETGN